MVKKRRLPAETKGKSDMIKKAVPELAIADAVTPPKNEDGKKKKKTYSNKEPGRRWLRNVEYESKTGEKSRKKSFISIIITFIILTVLIGYAIFFLFFTHDGASTFAGLGETGTQLKNIFQKDTAEVNIVKQALTGQYDFSQTWRSDVQQTKYEGKDVGAVLTNVGPIKDTILISPGDTTDKIIIVGSLKIVSVPATIRDDAPSVSAIVTSKFNGNDIPCANIAQARKYSNRFTCEHPGITNDILGGKPVVAKEAQVNLDYNFETLSGKTLYAIKNDEFSRLVLDDIDILQHFEIKKRRSWQTESPVGLGIGLSGESDTFPANSDDNLAAHFLGITIENKGDGKLNDIRSITLEVPADLVYVEDGNDFSEKINAATNLHDCDSAKNTCKYEIGALDFTLEPGFKENVYFKFTFPEDKLEGKDFEELFLLADVEFNYTQTKFNSITIRER